jgi:DNA-binding winged helix-turn-helix (wHTH) protein/Tfp pilus assembly protein PilF
MSIYRFRNCTLNPRERRIEKNGEIVNLTSKTFDILQLLVERAGEVVTRDEILGAVWNGTLVEESNLSVHISKLRRSLGDSNSERYIETVSGSGYRFIPSVDPVDENASTNGHYPGPYDHLGRDSEAIRYYLKGKYFYDKCTIADAYKAVDYFEKSLAHDPANVHAYVELIRSNKLLFSFDQISHKTVMSTINPILSIVSAFDQNDDVLQVTYGEVKLSLEWDFREAEKCFRRAIAINPRCSTAVYRLSGLMHYMERLPEALEKLSELRSIDPFSLQTYLRIGRLYYMMGHFENALQFLSEAHELEPECYECLLLLGSVLTELDDYDGALSAFNAALKEDFDNEAQAMMGYLFARNSETDKASEIIHRIETTAPVGRQYNVQLARIHLALGNKKVGYRFLDRAFQNHEGDLVALNVDPRWKVARHDDEFQSMIERVGIFEHSNQR